MLQHRRALGSAPGMGAGEEVQAAGFQAPDWIRVCALEKLVPSDMLVTLIGRSELDTYSKKVQ